MLFNSSDDNGRQISGNACLSDAFSEPFLSRLSELILSPDYRFTCSKCLGNYHKDDLRCSQIGSGMFYNNCPDVPPDNFENPTQNTQQI